MPFIGLLWNPRLLPLLYFVRYLLMMVGHRRARRPARRRPPQPSGRRPRAACSPGSVTFGVAALSVLLVLGFMFEVLPGGGRRQSHDKVVYAWGPLRKTATGGDAQGDGWSRYNFTGYEGRTQYPEYYDVVTTMTDIGRTNGCGRALWENNEDNGQYGTTMALMLLPHWTDGCIASMEGLFFEASGTTPYHFLTTAAMSKQSSNPVRELRYVDNDASVGVPHLQALGVRYAMVRTEEAKRRGAGAARADAPRDRGAVGDLPGRRFRRRRPARHPARRRRTARRRPARAQPRARHELVPAPRGVGGAPRRRRARRVAADRRRRRREPSDSRPHPSAGRPRHPWQAGRHRGAGPADRARPARPGPGQRRRDGRAGPLVPGRPGRCAGAGEGELLPELGGRRRRGPVPRRPQPDGRRADRQRGPPALRPERVGAVLLRPHPGRHRLAGVLPPPGRRAASTIRRPAARGGDGRHVFVRPPRVHGRR